MHKLIHRIGQDRQRQYLLCYSSCCFCFFVVAVVGANVFKKAVAPSGFLYANFVELHNLWGLGASRGVHGQKPKKFGFSSVNICNYISAQFMFRTPQFHSEL